MIITIDNHITSSGSYYRFQKWLKELSEHEEPLPEGLLFLAFDNEQRRQKNYLNRGSNTVIFHIVTSFVAFNMASQNKIQYTNSPWAYHSLNRLQYEELFDINPQMQEALNKELYDFLSEICNLLSEERRSSTNTIDSFVASAGTNTTSMKKCPNCYHQNIENRKQICPKCKIRLPTLAEIQKEREAEIENKIIDLSTMPTMPHIYKPYILNNESNITSTSRISHT